MPKKKIEMMEVVATFRLEIPKTSRENAEKIMMELIDNMNEAADQLDTLIPTFYKVFLENDEKSDAGYSYGFDSKLKFE